VEAQYRAVDVLAVTVVRSEVPTDVTGIIMLVHFLIAVYMCGRIDERIQRLQFLWTQEVKICDALLFCTYLVGQKNAAFWHKIAYRIFSNSI